MNTDFVGNQIQGAQNQFMRKKKKPALESVRKLIRSARGSITSIWQFAADAVLAGNRTMNHTKRTKPSRQRLTPIGARRPQNRPRLRHTRLLLARRQGRGRE